MSINKLIEKTFIFNPKYCNEPKSELRKKIHEWYKECYEIIFLAIIMDCAATCTNLRIIFYFEHEKIHYEEGLISRSTNSWIFIQTKNSEHEIKGAFANELCRYVMRTVYQNFGKPYWKNDIQAAEKYEKIIDELKNVAWKRSKKVFNPSLSPDFERCCEYDLFSILFFQLPQILAQFNAEKQMLEYFKDAYKPLDRYFKDVVIPDVELFVKMQNLSKIHNVSEDAKHFDIKTLKNVSLELENSLTIIQSNIPKLLFVNVHNYLHNLQDGSFDTTIFMSTGALQDLQTVEDINNVLKRNFKLNFIIDCSKEFCGLEKLDIQDSTCKFTLILSNNVKLNEVKSDLKNILEPKLKKSSEINFQWNDLTEKSQELLMQTKVSFQSNLSVTLQELMFMADNQFKPDGIVDDQLLSLFIGSSKITINKENKKSINLLYKPRTIIKNGTAKLSELEFIEDNENEQFIVLSGKIGTGKSCTLRNISIMFQEKYPQRWTTFVDLKEFIMEFKEHKMESNFLQFLIEEILTKKSNFEKKLFENFYKNGKVSIFFTRFEAIPANCLQFVTKLAESIKLVDGNQVWIASADYFEDFLKQTLNLATIYKLEKFKEHESVEFVASNCLLNDIKNGKNQKSGLFTDKLQSSQLSEANSQSDKDSVMIANSIQKTKIFNNYQIKAAHMMDKVANLNLGLLAFYKTIANFMSNDENPGILKVFEAFVEAQLRKYLQKGTETQSDLSKIHQYYAIKSYFPDNRPSNKWQEQQVIRYGFVVKIEENYEFVHETLREYFAAEFILQTMVNKDEIDGEFCKQLFEVLTVHKFAVVRMFLNEGLDNFNMKEVEDNFKDSRKEIKAIINKMDNISVVFQENVANLVTVVIHFLEIGNYETTKQIISKNTLKILKNSKMFLNFYKFLVKFLQPEDFKELIMSQNILQAIVSSKIRIEDFEQILIEMERKINKDFVIKALTSTTVVGENLFVSTQFETSEFHQFFYILLKFLHKDKILEMMKNCNKNGQNILEVAVSAKSAKYLETIWKNVESFSRIFESSLIFKELVSGLQHAAANCKKLEIHETLWKLLKNSFEDLREFLLQKDNYIHLVISSDNFEVIEFTIGQIKENFENSEKILQSMNRKNHNLLQTAVSSSISIKNLQFLWAVLQDSFKCDAKFLEFVKTCDFENKNVLHLAASFGSYEMLEFLIKILEKLTSVDEIKNLIAQNDNSGSNILQLSVKSNKSFKVHEHLWNIIQKYFTESEFLEFIINLDSNDKSICRIAFNCDSREFMGLLHREAKFLHYVEKRKKWKTHTKLDSDDSSDDDNKGFRFTHEIDDLEILFCLQYLSMLEKTIKSFTKNHLLSLHRVATSNRVDLHKILWHYILRNIKDRKKLFEILMEKNQQGNNFFHIVVINCHWKVIQFTFKELSRHLIEEDCPKVIKSKGYNGRNILQLAVCNFRDMRSLHILWNDVGWLLSSEDELRKLFKDVDNDGNGIFQLAASFGTLEVIKFTIEEAKDIFPKEHLKEMLNNLNYSQQNILQSALIHNRSIELHQFLWEIIILQFFNFNEIKSILKHKDESDCNAFLCAVSFNSFDVIEAIWNKIKNHLLNHDIPEDFEIVKILQQNNKFGQNFIHICIQRQNLQFLKLIKSDIKEFFIQFAFDDNFKDLVMQKTQNDHKNFLHLAANYDVIELHEVLWDILLESCKENTQELENFLTQRDKDGQNFLDILNQNKNSKVLEFTANLMNKKFKNSIYQKLLSSYNKDVTKNDFMSSIAKDNELHDDFLNCLISSKFVVQNLKDSSGQNLLNLSIIRGKFDATKKLINLEFDLDFECCGKRAIDYAWEGFINSYNADSRENFSQIILTLLKKNSRFPSVNFSYEMASNDIRTFIDTCLSTHNAVRNNKVQEIEVKLKTEPSLCYFYDTSNQSLLSHAIKNRNMKICHILIKYGLKIGSHENLISIYQDLSENKRKSLRKFNIRNTNQSSKNHIAALISKSTIYPQNHQNYNCIKEIFEILDQDSIFSLILQTAAMWNKLKITFDFASDTVYYFDPSASVDTMSISYSSGNIIFGVKNIKDEHLKNEVISSLIHELCHAAMFMTFMNGFKPYPAGRSEMKDRFENVVDECVENQEHDRIIEGALKQKNMHAELIVTAVQIKVHYLLENSQFKQEELLRKENKFEKLFKYLKSNVIPEMKQALKVLKDLGNNKKNLTFENLTNPMKLKIIHSSVKFQGTKTTFFNIIENSTDVLDKMTFKDIRDIILNSKIIEIGQDFHKDSKVQHKLQKFSKLKTKDENVKILVRSNSKNDKILNEFQKKLKSCWISNIKLANYRTAFENFVTQNELDSDKLREFLLSILNLESQLEIEIFKHLFNSKKVILLIDAQANDKKINQKNFKIIKYLYKIGNCKLWVLTDQQNIDQYEEFLEHGMTHRGQTIEEECNSKTSSDEEFYDFDDDSSVEIAKWRNDNKFIHWKATENDKIYTIKFDDDIDGEIQEYCKNFIHQAQGIELIDDLPNTESGSKLDDLKDKNGINLLIYAVNQGNIEMIDKLLRSFFDTDHCDIYYQSAIDHAWKIYVNAYNSIIKAKTEKIILNLLMSNSKFPSKKFGFRHERLSEELLKFVDISEQMHRAIEHSEIEHVKSLLNQNPNLRYFYDINNETALMYALKRNRRNILNILHGELLVRHDENLSLIYCDYPMYKSIAFSGDMGLPKSHILLLKSKTRISKFGAFSQEHWIMIENIYKEIDEKTEVCSKILKIAAILNGLRIFFDFKNTGVDYEETRTRQSRSIMIGAKDCFTEKSKIISALIREFCKVAVEVSCLDYFGMNLPIEKEQKSEFMEPQNEFDEIVKTVINSYPKSDQNFDLYNYFTQIDEIKLIYIIKMLQDDTKRVEFRDLTEPMKLKVLNSPINLQGIETSLIELIENDKKVLKILPSDWIKNAILETKSIEIGQKYAAPENYVDRKFVNLHDFTDQSKISTFPKNLNQIINEAEEFKIVVLEDLAATGKSTTLAVLVNKLKEIHKNFWISFTKIRNQQKLMQTCPKDDNLKLLMDILNITINFEQKIFTKMLENCQVIMLLDGVDEISPSSRELIFKLLNDINIKQIWISTRPQTVDKLNNAKFYKFAPLTITERDDLILMNLKSHQEIPLELKSLFNLLEHQNNIISNPLMIKIITQLFIDNNIKLDTEVFNFYTTVDTIYDANKLKLCEKLENFNHDFNSMEQVFALKFIFGHQFKEILGFNIDDLAMIRNWTREKHKFPSELMKSYGFVTDDLENGIEFIHKSYAEYFVAKYIISFLFDYQQGLRDREYYKVFNILRIVKENPEFFKNISTLIFDYFKVTDVKLHKLMRNLISNYVSTFNDKDELFNSLLNKD